MGSIHQNKTKKKTNRKREKKTFKRLYIEDSNDVGYTNLYVCVSE